MDGKVVVDSSVWIDFFRDKNLPTSRTLMKLLDSDRACLTGIVLTELLRGARNNNDLESIRDLLRPVPSLEVNKTTWEEAGDLAYRLARKGFTVFTVDAVIAAMALQNNIPLYTRDKHFRTMAGHSSLQLFLEDSV